MDRIPWLKCLFFSFKTLLILLSFLGLASVAATTPASCHPDQQSALLELKKGFIKSNLISWRPGTDCCHGWEGVSCDETTGLVSILDLSSYGIEGNLSAAIFNLTSLQHLNLAWNNFSQNQIPDGFEKLKHLIYLNLSYSYFTGQIPIGIANLTGLVSLDLSGYYNNLSLRIPNLRMLIRNLTNMKELHLDYVNISENGTEWCGALSDSIPLLQVLSMRFCNLSGPFDSSLSRLHSLTKMDLSGNSFHSSVPGYFSDFPLKYLELSYSNLTGSFPRKIFQISTLTILDISFNEELIVGDIPLGSSLEIFNLLGTKFRGDILYSIVNLQNLSSLVLSRSNLSQQIPSSFGKLVKLHHLDMSENSLHGSIPQSLFALPNLETLFLDNNKLSGQLRLDEEASILFSPLTDLGLSNNLLTGSIPRSIYKLSNLQSLDLNQNQFTGPIPSTIFRLSSLQFLYLHSNKFNGTFKLSMLQHLLNLTELYLSDNQLSLEDVSNEEIPSPFPTIKSFGLASCNLSQIPRLLRYHDGLIDLDLSNNNLHGVIPSWIWEIFSSRFLNSFNLSYNMFTSVENISICPLLPVCWMFHSIDLSYNKIKGHLPLIGAELLDYSNNEFSEIPSNYEHYLNATSSLRLSANRLDGNIQFSICDLFVIDLSKNNLSGLIPSCIFEARKLQVLILAENKFQGIVHHNIQKPCQLLLLDLSNNDLVGELPRSLAWCRYLMVLNIESNYIVDTFPFWLGNILNLQVLILNSNRFYGSLEPPLELASNNSLFQELRIFGLASNNFHGSLSPLFFWNLKSMINSSLYHMTVNEFIDRIESVYHSYEITIINKGIQMILKTLSVSLMIEIDLSNNKFGGHIPEMIGNLSALTALNLSHNTFSGSIPHSLKGLNHIESLDLSWNNLSGEIPQELISLDSLSKLNLSSNHLVGRIPQSPHFSTFDDSSFEGNPGLCGVPLSKQCAGASPTKNSTFPSASTAKNMTTIIFLCLFVGLGFGTGFAIAIVYPVIKRAKTRLATL